MQGQIDPIGMLRRIMNTGAGETFDPATDSLEALAAILASLNLSLGLFYSGTVDAVPGANQFTVTALAGLGAGKFDGATNPYQVFVLRDGNGLAAAPQGEMLPVTAYDTTGGTFTTAAFTAAIAAADEVMILHPALSGILGILAVLAVPAADAIVNVYERDVIGSKDDTASYALTTASIMRYVKGLIRSSIIATGTLTTSSATVPADTGRTEGDDYFKGCIFMTYDGAAAFQPRPIRQYTSVTDVFTLDEPLTVAPGAAAHYVILASDYPIQRLLDIFNETNAILELNETGGTLTSTGGVDTIYINNAPAGTFDPKAFILDCAAMEAGDTIIVRVYYRISAGGTLRLIDEPVTFDGAQAVDLKVIHLLPNRFGLQITLEQTEGAADNFPWEILYAD